MGAVGGDAGDDVVELIADPGVVAGVDGNAGGKGEGRGDVAGCGRKGLAGTGERGETGVTVVDDPGGAIGIEGGGDWEVQATVGEAGAGDGLAAGVVFGYGTETLVDGIGTLFVWDPDVVTGIDGEAVGVGEAGGAYAVGEQRLAGGGEFGGDAYGAGKVGVAGDPDVAGGVDAEGVRLVHASAGVVDEECPVDRGGAQCRRKSSAGG